MTAPDTFTDDVETVDPETPATDTPAPSEEEVHAETPVEAHPRDEKGRFAPKATDDADTGAVAAPTDAPVVPPTTAPDDPLAGTEPFTLRVAGQMLPIDGGHLIPGEGAIFSAEALPRVQQLLARGALYERERHAFEAERTAFAEQQKRPSANEVAYEQAATTMLQALTNEEELTRLLDPEYRHFFTQRLQLLVEKAQLEYQRTAPPVTSQPTEAASEAVETQHIADTVSAYAQHYGLTPEETADAAAYFQSLRPALVKTATDDALYAEHGIRAGEKYLDQAPLNHYFDRLAKAKQAAAEQAKKLQAAAEYNKKQQAPSKAPPVPAKAAATTPPKPKAKSGKWGGYESEDAWKDAFLRGELDAPS